MSRLHLFFFFTDTATTEIYTLSLHDALPIYCKCRWLRTPAGICVTRASALPIDGLVFSARFSRLLVARRTAKNPATRGLRSRNGTLLANSIWASLPRRP